MSRAYYNEIDPYCAQWLRNLIAAGHIAPGDVDERSIDDVRPDDLRGYTQCHFFAGIGGFSRALRLAGWPDNRAIWTGGPPCQNNSNAAAIHGHRTGLRGERSGLALRWLDLVAHLRPGPVVFENVPGITPWLAEIVARLEELGYSISRPECSSESAGALHLRRRVLIVANIGGERLSLARPTRSPQAARQSRTTTPRDFWREVKPGVWRMDDGLPTRMAQLRAFGNAIDPEAVAQALTRAAA
jgi:DNA (cytosine-5)-methyltransferase 1